MLSQSILKVLLTMVILAMMSTSVSKTNEDYRIATFAGGCFWCTQSDFDKLDGVIKTTVGYTGGSEENPTYQQVSSGATGHTEALRVVYDPKKVSYEQLLDYFWRSIDPTTANRQFCDVGKQYRSAIFYHDSEQETLANKTKQQLEKDKFETVYTEVVPAGAFYVAEEYHQDYYKKNPLRYKFYRYNCGRDKRLKQLWD